MWRELKAIIVPNPSAESLRIIGRDSVNGTSQAVTATDEKQDIQAPGQTGSLYFVYFPM